MRCWGISPYLVHYSPMLQNYQTITSQEERRGGRYLHRNYGKKRTSRQRPRAQLFQTGSRSPFPLPFLPLSVLRRRHRPCWHASHRVFVCFYPCRALLALVCLLPLLASAFQPSQVKCVLNPRDNTPLFFRPSVLPFPKFTTAGIPIFLFVARFNPDP